MSIAITRPGAEQERAANGELPDRAAAPDRDRVARLDVAELGGHVAGRKDVRQEQDLLVGEAVGNLDRADVGIRNPHIFGLPARVAAEDVRIAKQARRRVAPQLFRGLSIGIAAFAAGIEAVAAEEAFAAGDRERHDDPVAHFQIADAAADLDDLAHRFMAEHVAALHRGNHAVIDVEVGTADRAGGDFDDRVAGVLDLRVGHALAANVMLAVPSQRFHCGSLFSRRGRSAPRRQHNCVRVDLFRPSIASRERRSAAGWGR